MNKTLLLIICDFLLLNLIHFTAWDKLDEDSSKTPATGGPVVAGTGMGDPTQDLEFVALRYKNVQAEREDEKIKNAALQSEMNANEKQSAANLAAANKKANAWKNVFNESAKTNEVLQAATRELDREKTVALAERDKERKVVETITEERIKIQTDNASLTNKVNNLTGKIGDLNIRIDKAEGDAAAERKRAEAALIAKTKAEGERDSAITIATAATNQIKTIREFAAQQITTADTRVVNAEKKLKVAVEKSQAAESRAADASKELAVASKENTSLKEEVTNERTDKVIAQKAAEELRENIAKRIPDQPINANMMASLYFQNQLELQLQANHGLGRKKMASPTILIEVIENNKPYVHAITHVQDTPYQLGRKFVAFRESYGALAPRKSKTLALHHVRFLKADPRLIIIPVGPPASPQVKALGVKPYKLAAKPFKFPKAFIMSKSGRKFGTVEFKTDLGNRNYVKVDRIFFNFAGKFNPAKGDLVFSQTGELLGIMVNNKYCLVIQNAKPADAIMFGKNDSSKVTQVLGNMQKLIAAKPYALQ